MGLGFKMKWTSHICFRLIGIAVKEGISMLLKSVCVCMFPFPRFNWDFYPPNSVCEISLEKVMI